MMPSPIESDGTDRRRALRIASLAAAAVAAHVLEAALPSLGPWFKPGLANIFTLVALLTLGWRAALTVTALRVLVTALLMGSLFAPTFVLSLAGASAAMVALGLAPAPPLGPVGLSLLASLAHMAGQVVAGQLLFFDTTGIYHALPWFMIGSWITGVLNGLLAFLVLTRLRQHGWVLT